MPTVSLYIKNEDFDKWSKIEKKSEWLHDMLSGKVDGEPLTEIFKPAPNKAILEPVITTSKPYLEVDKSQEVVPCKHGADPKYCRHAKPGKPCK